MPPVIPPVQSPFPILPIIPIQPEPYLQYDPLQNMQYQPYMQMPISNMMIPPQPYMKIKKSKKHTYKDEIMNGMF